MRDSEIDHLLNLLNVDPRDVDEAIFSLVNSYRSASNLTGCISLLPFPPIVRDLLISENLGKLEEGFDKGLNIIVTKALSTERGSPASSEASVELLARRIYVTAGLQTVNIYSNNAAQDLSPFLRLRIRRLILKAAGATGGIDREWVNDLCRKVLSDNFRPSEIKEGLLKLLNSPPKLSHQEF